MEIWQFIVKHFIQVLFTFVCIYSDQKCSEIFWMLYLKPKQIYLDVISCGPADWLGRYHKVLLYSMYLFI